MNVNHLLCDILNGAPENIFFVMVKYWSRILEAYWSYARSTHLRQKSYLEVFQTKLCLLYERMHGSELFKLRKRSSITSTGS